MTADPRGTHEAVEAPIPRQRDAGVMGYVAELQQFDDSITSAEPEREQEPLGGEAAEPPVRPSPRRVPAGRAAQRTVAVVRVPRKEGRPPWTRTEVGLAVAFVLVAAVAIVGGAYAVLMANRPPTSELPLPLPSVEAAGERDVPVPTGEATPGGAGPGAERKPDASPTPGPAGSTQDDAAPGGGATPAPEATSAPPPPADLVARYSREANTGLLGLTGYRGKVTITNGGKGPADTWTVTLSLPAGQRVDGVAGARARQEGELVTFTPVAGSDGVAAGAATEFTFEVPGLLAGEPTGCSINGRPCE